MPDDDGIIGQLRRYAEAADAAAGDVRPLDARSRRRRRWVVAAAAAAVVALVAGGVTLAGRSDDATDVAAGDSGDPPPGWSTFPQAPLAARLGAVAAVADGELLVWSGSGDDGVLGDGAAWSIGDRSWRPLAPAPIEARARPVAAWTGDEWLVLGGVGDGDAVLLDGAAYDPGADTWRATAPLPMAVTAGATGAAWTGTELVVVGADGAAAYDLAADRWRTIAVDDGPASRLVAARGVAAVWTGREVLVVAITDGQNVVVDSLDPRTGSWGGGYPTPAPGLDTGEDGVVWTGEELLVVGHYESGARFDPATGIVDRLEPSGSQTRFGAVVAGRAVTVGDRWLDLDTMAWQDAEPLPEGRAREFPAAAGDGTAAYWWGGSACGGGGSCVRIVDPEIGLRWEPPARPPASTTTSTLATTDAAIGGGGWLGARTGADGRSLVVAFVGGAPYEEGVPCTVDYALEVEEDTGEVRIRIVQVVHPALRLPEACRAAGYFRTVEAVLAEPLGDRRVVDTEFGVERPVFDGRRLADPPALPPGWRLQREQGGYPDPAAATTWERLWAPDRPADTERCTGAPAGIGLVEGEPAVLDAYLDGSPVVGTFDVRGNEATARASSQRRDLSWVEGGQEYFLSSTLGCDLDTLATIDELVAFARGLTVP